jgi:hypothetical protein
MKGEVKLNRTDKRPLAFIGEEIYSGSTKDHDSTRWTVIRVFQTGNGFVVGIAHLTCWDGERDQYTAEKRKNITEIVALIARQVPELAEDSQKVLLNEQTMKYDNKTLNQA